MRKLIYLFLFSILIFSCKKTENENKITIIKGIVLDSSQKGISGVTISIPQFNLEAMSAFDGSYTISIDKVVNENTIVYIKYEKDGYFALDKHICLCTEEENVHMRSFADAAYFSIELNEKQVPSASGVFAVKVHTNVKYEIENINQWIDVKINNDSVYFIYNENEELTDRMATIKFNAEYNLSHEIFVTQYAGPVLRVIDYIGKDNITSFLTTVPFVTFNREIELLSVESSYKGIDLTNQISTDKKTILFPNVKAPVLEVVKITYQVIATDGSIIKDNFELKVYDSVIDSDPQNGQKLIFSNDNQSFWLLTSAGYENSSLIKYSAKDLSVIATIPYKQYQYGDFYYNPYNNTIILVHNYNYETGSYIGKLDIFDAETGMFIKEVDYVKDLNIVDEGQIFNMSFGNNGLGIAQVHSSTKGSSNLFFIDSVNDYECELFPNDMFEDIYRTVKSIGTCNNGNTLVVFEYTAAITTVDVNTKNIRRFTGINGRYGSELANYSYTYIFVCSEEGTLINVNTGAKSTMNINNNLGNYAAFLKTENELPTILTSDLAVANFQTKEEQKFEHSSDIFPFASSNDGKSVIIGSAKKLYLFRHEVFTKHYKKLK